MDNEKECNSSKLALWQSKAAKLVYAAFKIEITAFNQQWFHLQYTLILFPLLCSVLFLVGSIIWEHEARQKLITLASSSPQRC